MVHRRAVEYYGGVPSRWIIDNLKAGGDKADCEEPGSPSGLPERLPPDSRHATAPRPFFATSVRSFNEAPRGRFSPRSHWLTSPVVTLR